MQQGGVLLQYLYQVFVFFSYAQHPLHYSQLYQRIRGNRHRSHAASWKHCLADERDPCMFWCPWTLYFDLQILSSPWDSCICKIIDKQHNYTRYHRTPAHSLDMASPHIPQITGFSLFPWAVPACLHSNQCLEIKAADFSKYLSLKTFDDVCSLRYLGVEKATFSMVVLAAHYDFRQEKLEDLSKRWLDRNKR